MSTPPKSKFPIFLSLTIAIAAVVAFIWLDRKLAPPYPNSPTNSIPHSTATNTTDVFGETTSTNALFSK